MLFCFFEQMEKSHKTKNKKGVKKDEMPSSILAELQEEIDRISKLLIRRDFELSSVREQREKEIKELEERTGELEGARKALMNMLEDIEEARREAEEERDKTLAIIENFPEGLLFFDRYKKVSSVNPKIRDFFNTNPKDLIGRYIRNLKRISSLSSLAKLLGEEIKEIQRKELQLREDLVLEISTIPVLRELEEIGTLVVLRDITREKTIERLKTEFVSISAHQLRTPLSAIKWTLRMILDGDAGEVPKEQRELLEKSYTSNERMIGLINDLLNVTRIEEGRFLYSLKRYDIVKLVEKVFNQLKEMAQRKGLNFEFLKPKTMIPNVDVDAEKMSVVFQNLIDNAIHYTRAKGRVEVRLEYLKEKEQILFSVKDTGIGIPEHQQQRVFSRFFRGTNAIKSETEGTGLGLFISKNIVEAHGGTIWFKSEEDKGSTFYFTLPLKAKAEEFQKFVEGL